MIVAFDAFASCTSFSVMPPTPRCTITSFTSSRSSLRKRLRAGFERTLDVGLQDDVERRGLAALDLLEEVFESCPARRGDGLVTNETSAVGAGLGEGRAWPRSWATRISSPANGGSLKPRICTGVEDRPS
jgi:hypothetical protein